jgi:hypothetical protein
MEELGLAFFPIETTGGGVGGGVGGGSVTPAGSKIIINYTGLSHETNILKFASA